ncbi:MAG TPA: alpha/beta fold hydrolase [Nocardioides sp.]|uniref:esterase/lipase family protein n=1 Tax=uncultured Nocardioides sp. TaxID=198441 RepID=UPI002601EA6E|nr:alpha/beta fold hydrolase [uncultured Nocardioides sp.]HRD62852.1 alpha/beta fold hydrolase [Nocardioides sp.]HRI96028.1 alpha/beta fold hydrolase [Nocardioides sp.]HRK46226.1 alpha/beta fold hydrolase [Nocardioides sp.]
MSQSPATSSRRPAAPDPGGPLGSFLLPEGFARPRVLDVLRESTVVVEAGRHAVTSLDERRRLWRASYAGSAASQSTDPVILVPGFMAGDVSLHAMSRTLRRRGFRTYRSQIHVNVGCTVDAAAELESRIESIAIKREQRVRIVGHSLGGLLARGLAVRRPDLISGIVTMGSPMLAPAAHHLALTASIEVLVRLSRAGVPGLMSEDCVAGHCARESFEESREPMPAGVSFTAIHSRRDGIVDWRACIDPEAYAVEVTSSHLGMAIDPRVVDVVTSALRLPASGMGSVLEVDSGESA